MKGNEVFKKRRLIGLLWLQYSSLRNENTLSLQHLCLIIGIMKREWISTEQRKTEEKWRSLKYGLFIHYGLYSLCGGVWNGKIVEKGYSEQILSHGPVPQADYERLMEEFTAEAFDADALCDLALEGGMKYIVMVSKHHDGFCLFDTKTTTFSSTSSPAGRDLVLELSDACRRKGLEFGIYFSWIDWHFPLAVPISGHNSDVITDEHMEYNMAQLEELLSSYGAVSELWMDMGAPTPRQSELVYNLAHTLQSSIMVNGRVWNDRGDFVTMGDNCYPECTLDVPWQTPATIYRSTWGYRSWQKRENPGEKVEEIALSVKGVVERGGNYLLNIGLRGDGSVVEFERDVIRGAGRLLEKEGGLLRKENAESFSPLSVLSRANSTELFRYSGNEYYSLRCIVTGWRWNVLIREDGDYTLSYELDEPLKEELKMCIETDEDTFVFSMKRGETGGVVSSSVRLSAGREMVVFHTPGSPMKRPEAVIENFRIKLIKKKE